MTPSLAQPLSLPTETTPSSAGLIARSPFAGLTARCGSTPGVTASVRDDVGIAAIQVRHGQGAALARAWREHTGMALPRGPERVEDGGIGIVGTGPQAWLATKEGAGNAFAAELDTVLTGIASVTDQGDGYALLRLAGPKVRAMLAKLVPLDLHDRAFPVGAVAGTVAAHMGALLWRLPDAGESTVIEIAVFRSMAGSLWHAVSQSAAEFGLDGGA